MAISPQVLIADPDVNAVRPLVRSLRQRGYRPQVATDGAKALEIAVLRTPDVVLYDVSCPIIDAGSFARILASNPRTERIPLVVTGRKGQAKGKVALEKPFDLDEARSRIDSLYRRAEAERALRGDGRSLEGGLGQLPLPDVLQILSMNRRTGRLALSLAKERAELFVVDGRPVHARHGEVSGEKALFRVMSWQDGSFAFAPAPPSEVQTIDRTMEAALLEGVRHVDECARLWSVLPEPETPLKRSLSAPAPVDPHPVTAEVLKLLESPMRLGELVDQCVATDLEVLVAVQALLERGWVTKTDEVTARATPFLGPAEVHALRGRLMRAHPGGQPLVMKVLVIGAGNKAGRAVLRGLADLDAPLKEPPAVRSSFGTLGSLAIDEGLRFDFVMVPFVGAARPLWQPFTSHLSGALLLDDREAVLPLARFVAFERRTPMVVVGAEVPSSLLAAPAGVVSASTLRPAIKALASLVLKLPVLEEPRRPAARKARG